MALPGTQLVNKVLQQITLGRGSIVYRLYCQKRANDRSHKIWGQFNQADAVRLQEALTKAGALNARLTQGGYGRTKYISGVRFEMPAE